MNLTKLTPLKIYTVKSCGTNTQALMRLRRMGFIEGIPVMLLKKSGKDMIIRYGGTRAAISNEVAESIIV